MKYNIVENTSADHKGFFAATGDGIHHLTYGMKELRQAGSYSFYCPNKFRNFKTAREAIGQLQIILGKKLRRTKLPPRDYGYPVRYTYSD